VCVCVCVLSRVWQMHIRQRFFKSKVFKRKSRTCPHPFAGSPLKSSVRRSEEQQSSGNRSSRWGNTSSAQIEQVGQFKQCTDQAGGAIQAVHRSSRWGNSSSAQIEQVGQFKQCTDRWSRWGNSSSTQIEQVGQFKQCTDRAGGAIQAVHR